MVQKTPIKFKIPEKLARLRAIGKISNITKLEKSTFSSLSKFYYPIPMPGPDDWLATHKTTPQSFARYEITEDKMEITQNINKIYILPLDISMSSEFVGNMQQICMAFFTPLEVEVLESVSLKKLGVEKRKNFGILQYHAGQICDILPKYKPRDAYCLIGITNWDLYPDPLWNYVLGLSDLKKRVGVFSFIRNNPTFYGGPKPPDLTEMILRDSSRFMIHEIGHMFGLYDCSYYTCIMNGSNHKNDYAGKRAIDFCPVCLRKLQFTLKFNYLDRFIELNNIYSTLSYGFKRETKWLRERISLIKKKLKKLYISD